MRSRIDDAEMRGNILRHGNRYGVATQGISANFAVPTGAPHVLILNPGASTNRNVTLPASPKKGDWFTIGNGGSGTSVLTLQDSAAAALTPATTIAINKLATVVWDGTKWWPASYA